jgi:hypothetical protein
MSSQFNCVYVSPVYSNPQANPSVYPYNGGQSIVADLNGDGLPDLFEPQSNFNVPRLQPIVWKNLGNGQFTVDATMIANLADTTAGSTIAGGYGLSMVSEIIAADFNKDGKTDYLIVDNGYELSVTGRGPFVGSPLHVLMNNGTGVTYNNTSLPQSSVHINSSAAVGDVNGDGYPDVLTANFDDGVTLYTNNKNGTFTASNLYSALDVSGVTTIQAGGQTQVVVGSYVQVTTPPVVLGQNAQGQWTPLYNLERITEAGYPNNGTNASWGAHYLYNLDINGDGRQDLLIVWEQTPANTRQVVTVYTQNTAGTLVPQHNLDLMNIPGQGAIPLMFQDLNADGFPDIVVQASVSSNQIGNCILINDQHGLFVPLKLNVSAPTGLQDSSLTVHVADLNKDGKIDIMATQGVFSPMPMPTGQTGVREITWFGNISPKDLNYFVDGPLGWSTKIVTVLCGSTGYAQYGCDTAESQNLNYSGLAQFAVNASGLTNINAMAKNLWTNIVGTPPTPADIAPYLSYTPANLLMYAADYHANLIGVPAT